MLLFIILGFIGFLIIISLIWRLCSRRYTLPCPTWLRFFVELDNPFTKVNRAATIVQYLDLTQGMKVLDVGCGPGRLTIPVAHKVGNNGEVVAMDMQQGMLDCVQEKVKKAGLTNVTLLHAKIGDQQLEHNVFDRVLLVTVLGEIPNQQAALKEIFYALKTGGILSVTEIIFDPHFQRQGTVLKAAHAVGFREKNVFGNSIAYTMHLEKQV